MKAFAGILSIILFSSLVSGICHGQDSFSASSLFTSDSILDLTLMADLEGLLAYTVEEADYQEARLIYEDPRDQSRVEMKIQARARGSFRRKPENCDFPPLKLKFDKIERQNTIFENFQDVKLVTHCQTNLSGFEQYVLGEYLIYKAYNIFTDYSFRVRLARITYIDLLGKMDTLQRFAFIIENTEQLAERNQCELLELESVPPKELDLNHYTLMSLFNYMILNTDYSIPIVHNVILVSSVHFSPPVPVPYDFDWSGILNIPYDSPFAGSKTKYSDQQYKGPCLKSKELEPVISAMLSKQDLVCDLYRDCPYLDGEMRARSLQDLSMFFITISNRKLIRKEFIKKCKD